jgi:hypothetical protein
MLEERIGYFGFKKKKIITDLNEKYGDRWKLMWKWGSINIKQDFAIQLYEDAYLKFLEQNTPLLDWVINTAKDVYDLSISNIDSGLDYNIQEDKYTHLQDIAVRRAILRLGCEFKGDKLIQIRGNDSEGYVLNPGQVPFHLPDMIVKPSLKGWWKEDSVEDFYQSNKIIIIPEK